MQKGSKIMAKRIFAAFLVVVVVCTGFCSCRLDENGYLIVPGEDPETRNSLQIESNGLMTLMLWNFIVDDETWTGIDTILLVPFAIVAVPVVVVYELCCAAVALFVIAVMLLISGNFG